jgi:hypothetical protein
MLCSRHNTYHRVLCFSIDLVHRVVTPDQILSSTVPRSEIIAFARAVDIISRVESGDMTVQSEQSMMCQSCASACCNHQTRHWHRQGCSHRGGCIGNDVSAIHIGAIGGI